MVFSSLTFIFAFFPAVLICYFIIPKRYRRARNAVLLIFSLFFYLYGEPRGIFVMLLSITANYLLALAIEKLPKRKLFLFLTAAVNLGVLCFYKYTGFFLENINFIFNMKINIPQIIMPIGISFFTFQGMSYVFDVYNRDVPAQKNIFAVALYISLFPQLVAGPIVRYQTVADEIVSRDESVPLAYSGFRRFIIGLAKKMFLANSMGVIATDIFARNPANLPAACAWLGAVAYSFQIFFDFSAYSDMAIGMGRIFGFHFLENFNYPYISKSITEFWRRWHMSLSTWFRDYVYIPLGGNRKGILRQLFNILVVWSLTGLWHGASWNFIAWGLYFAVILIIEKLFLGKLLKKAPAVISRVYTLLLIILGWVLFNSRDINYAFMYARAMFSHIPLDKTSLKQILYYLNEYRLEFVLSLVFSTPILRRLNEKYRNNKIFEYTAAAALLVIFAFCILSVVSSTFNPFIYFRF